MARLFPGNPWRGVAGLPAAVWLVFATTLVNRAGTMVVPFMVLYVNPVSGRAAGARRTGAHRVRSRWPRQWTDGGPTVRSIRPVAVLHGVPGLLAAAVVWTFGEMIAIPASGAYAADIAPRGRAGQYAGAYAAMFSLAILVGPWAGTIALERFGGTALWSGVLVIGLLGAAVLSLTDHRPLEGPP
jgi:MFS family permease